jgi:sugar lactone lactonase YvrE
MKTRLTLILMGALLLALLLACGAAAAPAHAATFTPRLVTSFSAGDYGSFAEGMAADRHGNLWVSLTSWGLYDDTVDPPLTTSNIGQIWKVTPSGVATLKATVDLTDSGMLLGVAIRQDHVFVALFDGGAGTIPNGVYRLRRDGKFAQVVSLDEGVWPNGIAFHGRALYITDSTSGAIWRARIGSGVTTVSKPWLKDDLLAPGDPATDPTKAGIGVNGIAFRGDHAYVSVADGARIVRVGVRKDGRHGSLHTVCEKPALLSADGIAFDATGGLWITTNHGTTGAAVSGGLFRLSPKGVLRTVADDPGSLNYPTTPVFGTTGHTHETLFIENGAYSSFNLDGTHPDIQALRVGVPGMPLR